MGMKTCFFPLPQSLAVLLDVSPVMHSLLRPVELGRSGCFYNTFLSFAFFAPPLCVCLSLRVLNCACESAAVTVMSLTVSSDASERAYRSVGGRGVCAL